MISNNLVQNVILTSIQSEWFEGLSTDSENYAICAVKNIDEVRI